MPRGQNNLQLSFLSPGTFRILPGLHRSYSCNRRTENTQGYVSSEVCCTDSEWKTVSPREKRTVLVPQSWHNKTGEIVRQLADDLWVVERGYIFLGQIDVGGRTSILRLFNGGLLVHAPLALTPVLKKCIDDIGIVSVVIAPNTEHVDFIGQWKTYYPNASYLGPPGCLSNLPHIPFTGELARDSIVHPTLADSQISQFFIASAPFFNETLFVHNPTRTLFCTDFFWAYPTDPDVPRPTRAWAWAMNNVYKPVYDWVLVNNQQEFQSTLSAILNSGFERIVPCHGDIIERNGREVLSEFFANKLSR